MLFFNKLFINYKSSGTAFVSVPSFLFRLNCSAAYCFHFVKFFRIFCYKLLQISGILFVGLIQNFTT